MDIQLLCNLFGLLIGSEWTPTARGIANSHQLNFILRRRAVDR
jgi:hypothetical protein